MPPGQRESHAAILRGLAVLFVLCQVASAFGVMPNLLQGGLAPLLELPFFAPSLLGAFAAQVMLRPRRDELVATGVLAVLLALPIFALAAGRPWAVVNTACAALGVAALSSLGVSALRRRGSEREDVLDVLRPAAILPAFVSLAHPMVYLTAVLWPTTYDHRMYAADWALGGPISFTIARLTDSVPLLGPLCLLVYVCLPLALMLVHAGRQKRGIRSSDALVAFVAVTVVGYVGYNVVPVTGPGYVFGDAFPLLPPDPASLGDARSVALPMPRNCMPSLHSAWALLVWWNARPLSQAARASATVFFAITLLATVALGFHYVVDLVAAFPLTLAAQAWATRVSDPRRRHVAIVAGSTMTAAWIAFVTWSDAMLALPSVVLVALAVLVVGLSSWLERRVYEVGTEHAADNPPVPASSRSGRVATLALFLLGLAGWLHGAIVFHALARTAGATPETRTTVTLVMLAAMALGVAAAARFVAIPGASTRVAALAAAALAPWSWLALRLAPATAPGDVVPAGLLFAAALAAPAPLLTGLAAPGIGARPATWQSPLLLGAATGALLGGYAVLPTARSVLLPVVVYAAAAVVAVVLAVRDRGQSVAPRGPTPSAVVPSLLAAVVASVVVTVQAHLVTAMLGDTAYARSQVAAVVCAGLASGALLARRVPGGGGAAVWIHAALAASIVATLALWTEVPAWFASFRVYIDRFHVMGEFSQHEFIRLCCAAFFLFPASALAGLAIALPAAAAPGTGAAGLAVAAGPAGAMLAAFFLIPALGSGSSLVASAAAAIALGALAVAPPGVERRRVAAGALIFAAVALFFVAGRLDAGPLAGDSALTFRESTAGAARGLAESIGSVATLHGRDGTGHAELRVNGLVRSRSAGEATGGRIALPAGRSRALVIGLGSGATTRALVESKFLQVTATETSTAAAGLARSTSPGQDVFASASVVVRIADGRAALQTEETKYDVVLVDEPELSGPEAATRCTTEFYALAAARLLPGGVLFQQLSLARLSPVALASVLASARTSFREMHVDASGEYATLIACADTCPASEPAAGGAGHVRVDAAGIDALLASVAGTIDVPVDSLPAGDDDLFLRYQTPVSFRAAPGEVPASRTLLETFANRNAAVAR